MRKVIVFFCLAIIGISTLLSVGCKIKITVPKGGKVVSKSGAYECQAKQECVINIYDLFFDEEFVGKPAPGYGFVAWDTGDYSLCGNKSSSCKIVSALAQKYPILMQILESDNIFNLRPVFFAGEGPIKLGVHEDGASLRYDFYPNEANWRTTNIAAPHQYDKAYNVSEATFLSTASNDFYYTKLRWWGFYRLKDRKKGDSIQKFKITIYEDAAYVPGKVVSTITTKASVKPVIDHLRAPFTEPFRISSANPQYDDRILYEYDVDVGASLFIPKGTNAWLSIVEIDPSTGFSNSDFVWHAQSGPSSCSIAYLTDFGADGTWLRGFFGGGCRPFVNITGIRGATE